ncbi:MAG: 4-hydroxy-tetrahydrodipicolinate reductase [Candidatus Methanomethylophilaceae archaeon]
MIDVVIGGATGRLGSLVCNAISRSDDIRLRGAVVSADGGNVGREILPGVFASGPESLNGLLADCDVYVDLTSPAAASKVVAEVPRTGANIIVGTTSVDPAALENMRREVERHGTSGLISANFSRGVNVFWRTCEVLASQLDGYDIEVVEAHHASKGDAPSGTSSETVRRLVEQTGIERIRYGREGVTGPRGREICVHSIRAGNIVGDHTVMFAKGDDIVEFTHRSVSRETFADGCIESIRWMAGRRDGRTHNMFEVFGL